MSICVVAIHTQPFENCSNPIILNVYQNVVSLAVPFFFIASGFLLSTKLKWPCNSDEDIKTIKAYTIRITKLYLLWSLIYLPLAVYAYVYLDENSRSFMRHVISYIRGLLLVGQHYNSWILWYLLSVIYALIMIIFLLKKRFSLYRIAFIGVIIFFVSYFLTFIAKYEGELPVYLMLFQKLIRYSISSGRILQGSFYIPLGMLIAHRTFGEKIAYPLFIASFAAMMMTEGLTRSIFVAVCAVSLFVIVSRFTSDSPVYPFICNMSTVIYFIHMYVWSISYKILYDKKTYGMSMFILTVSICIIISGLYSIICRKRMNS